MKSASRIFRANDIRGVYKKDFDLSFCKGLATSLAYLLKKDLGISSPKVLIGYDARLSSPKIGAALVDALLKEGVDVCCIGIAPSPLCYFLLHHYNLAATVVITASHNPPEDNGFKFLFHESLGAKATLSRIKEIYFENNLPKTKPLKGRLFEIDSTTPYIQSLKEEFSLKAIPFVVDTGNGALGPLAQKVFHSLKLFPQFLGLEPDGHFPNHHPDPTVEENLEDLKQAVCASSAAFGVSFDGDGDRLVLVTSKGKTVLGDDLAYLFLPSLLEKQKSSPHRLPLVADVKCSDWLFQFIKKESGKLILSQSGHRLTRKTMKENKGLAAFEFSGHIFFDDRPNRGFDDALYACLRVLELLQNGATLENLLPSIKTSRTKEIRLPLEPQQISLKLKNFRDYLEAKKETFVDIDGIRISRKTSWALIRKSQTQDALTLRFEASNKEDLLNLKKECFSVLKIPLK